MLYLDYKKLENMELYQFVNSEGEVALYQFDAYYYCDEWDEDAIILRNPRSEMRFEWPSCEFQFALDLEDDPKEFLEKWESGHFIPYSAFR